MNEKDVIRSKLLSTLTSRMKKEAWSRITADVNSGSNSVVRTTADCKKIEGYEICISKRER